MTIYIGVSLEETNALQDASDYLNERGMDIKLLITSESNLFRDKFNSIKKRTPTEIELHAYPVNFSPTDEDLRKGGIKEKVDVMITLATKDLTDNSLSYKLIDEIRHEVELEGHRYTIKDKSQINHFSHVFLNVNLGLFRK